jgi:hypothetical protein
VNSEYEKLIAECLAEMDAPPMTAAERAYMERCVAAMDECYGKFTRGSFDRFGMSITEKMRFPWEIPC